MTKETFPTPEIARCIGKILASRPTPAAEVPSLVAALGGVFERLRQGDGAAATIAAAFESQAAHPVAEHAVIVAPVAATARQHAPRRSAARAPREPRIRVEPVLEPVPAPPAAPRLMRRAEVAPIPAAESPASLQPPPSTRRAGVVRWFDAKSGRGMLRVPGVPGDLALDAGILQRSGLSRLYKGQEIEATVTGDNTAARVVALALPGRVETNAAIFKTGAVRRNAKPVVVELKRDALRRAAARLEAEHLLGPARKSVVGDD
jgi:hypothetical protein